MRVQYTQIGVRTALVPRLLCYFLRFQLPHKKKSAVSCGVVHILVPVCIPPGVRLEFMRQTFVFFASRAQEKMRGSRWWFTREPDGEASRCVVASPPSCCAQSSLRSQLRLSLGVSETRSALLVTLSLVAVSVPLALSSKHSKRRDVPWPSGQNFHFSQLSGREHGCPSPDSFLKRSRIRARGTFTSNFNSPRTITDNFKIHYLPGVHCDPYSAS